VVERLSTGPCKAFSLPGGTLAPGSVADVTVIDPAAEWTVDAARFLSKGRNTPFQGMRVAGRAEMTIVGGKIVYRRAE
jgi:dihydroorotase